MIISLAFFIISIFQIQAALWNPWEGQSMKSFVRGGNTKSQRFLISQSDFYNSAYIGYFKFNSINPLKNYSLMKLQISEENYTFLHLYTKGSVPYLKVIFDESNYSFEYSVGPVFLAGTWYSFGFGYNQSLKTSYLIYQIQPFSVIYQQPQTFSYSLPARITQFELCVACQPQEYLYTKFDGSYSTIKMLTQFDQTNGALKFYFNENDMSTSLLRTSQSSSADVLVYAISKYTFDLSTTCLTSTKFYYDGLCIEKSECGNLIYNKSTQFGYQNSVFWNTSNNTCDTCQDNCLLCNSSTVCQQCNFGYALDVLNNLCKKCISGTYYDPVNLLCVSTCPTGYQSDIVNQTCVLSFESSYHLLNSQLVQRNFIQNDGFSLINSSSSVISNQYTQCYLDINSFGPYTILGGQNTLTSYKLNKKILGLPKNYKKTIFFQAIIYNNGQQNDFNLKVNNNLISLASFSLVFNNESLCTDNQLINLYELTYIIEDSSTDLDIFISANQNGWGIRNFSMNITKCHSTCLDCSDGYAWTCTSCDSQANSINVNNNCACNKGQYTEFQNCYSSPCYACANCPSNCLSCEDQTGKCTSCTSGYSVQNGLCVLTSQCNGYYINDPLSSYCIKQNDLGLIQFVNDKITSNIDFWEITGNSPSTTSCYSRMFAPYLSLTYSAKLAYLLQNYELFHFALTIDLSATNIDHMDQSDSINYLINTSLVKTANYYTTSTTDHCFNTSFGEELVQESFVYPTKSNDLTFSIESHLVTSQYYAFNDVKITYTRCHASCSNCNNGNSCSQCILNSQLDATQGNFCYCNDGYFFTYDWSNSSGLCLKCNPFCKTCNGPNITDCLTCQESYKLVNNICVFACDSNQIWDWTLHKCINCSDCCATCNGTSNNQCTSCYAGQMTLNSSICKFNTDNSTCNSCNIVNNSLCGGSQTNHSYCLSKGWASINSTTCVNCLTIDANGNCGGASQYNIVCNQLGYFYSSTAGSCLSCAQTFGTDCGDISIRNTCTSNRWVYQSVSSCTSCQTTQNCCHSTCNTCNGQNDNNCLSCSSSMILFNGYCLEKCPNGYKLDISTNTCQQCPIFTGVPECNNCSGDCKTCSINTSSQCNSCYSSRILDVNSNRCLCKDQEDIRSNFYECSSDNQAVLDVKLLNSSPKLIIDFGKTLEDLPGLFANENSNNVCKVIFDETNLNLIGVNSKCQISQNIINIELDESANIMNGDILNFKPNILKFKINSSVYINTFKNNVVIQETPVNTLVVFIYNSIENTCNDFKILFDKILNGSQRGFKTITWSLLNPTSSNAEDVEIQSILSLASSQSQTSIIVPKGTISVNVQKQIKVHYLLKNTFQGEQTFTFEARIFKAISSNLQSDMIIPYYRFQEFTVSLTYSILYCNEKGQQLNAQDPVDISIASPQSPLINTNLVNSEKTQISFKVNQFTFDSNQNNQIIVKLENLFLEQIFKLIIQNQSQIKISSDPSISSSGTLIFKSEPSDLIVKINGGDKKVDFKNEVALTSTIQDLDIEDQQANQGITITWTCINPSDLTQPCLDQNGQPFILDSNSPVIPSNTFKPYSIIKIQLKGSKDTRQKSDEIVVLFIEFDIPLLGIQLNLIDPFNQTVNLNEDIFTSLDYDNIINTDMLSFSGSLVYEDVVISEILFSYTTLKFKLWDLYSSFKRSSPSITLRFSVFNPKYFLPSISVVNLKINFPPDGCQFSISPSTNMSNIGYSMQTVFTLQMQGCVDDNLPLQYQFFIYKSQADFDQEITNPYQIKRKQLNNQSLDSTLLTVLPSGNLIIMAIVSDSLQAVFNSTIPITVTSQNIDGNQYLAYIDKALILTGKSTDWIITELSLICEDLNSRVNLQNSSMLNQKKISIIKTLISQSRLTSSLSTSSTLSDKSISSLIQTGIKFDETEEKELLNNLIQNLSDDWTTISYLNLSLVQKQQRNQQVYDYFEILDNLIMNSQEPNSSVQSLYINLSNLIADKMIYSSLPNEDSKYFIGNKLIIQSQQITEINVCKYIICNNYTPPVDSQTPLYNIAYKIYQQNPYVNEPSYQNFTSLLKQYIGNQSPAIYQIINPLIIAVGQTSPHSPLNTGDSRLQFQGSEKQGLSCLTKQNDKWSQNGCRLIFNQKTQLYSCYCQNQGPTTIVNDLDTLISNNKQQVSVDSTIQTQQQGSNTNSDQTDFYMYGINWLVIAETIIFLALIFSGNILDSIFDQTVRASNSAVFKFNNKRIMPFNDEFGKDSNENMITQLKSPDHFSSANPIEASNQHNQVRNKKLRRLCTDQFNNALPIKPSAHQKRNFYKSQKQKSVPANFTDLIKKSTVRFDNVSDKFDQESQNFEEQLDKEGNDVQHHSPQTQHTEMDKSSPDFKEVRFENQTIPHNETTNTPNTKAQSFNSIKRGEEFTILDLNEDDKSDKKKKFLSLNSIKQTCYFHNFVGIFLIFSSTMTRSLRFFCFYVRLIHSIVFSILFQQSENIAIEITLSVLNGILIIIFLNIIGIIAKKFNKLMVYIVLLALLILYFYLIFFAYREQYPEKSNQQLIHYFLFIGVDFLVISIISAIIQRLFAINALKKEKLLTCYQVIYNAIEIQLILESII